MGMDVMECVLHVLRLHWIEFNSKFYKADGYSFVPYRHKDSLWGCMQTSPRQFHVFIKIVNVLGSALKKKRGAFCKTSSLEINPVRVPTSVG